MKILVELIDAKKSTATELKTLIEEELTQVLRFRGFEVKVLEISKLDELVEKAGPVEVKEKS